jgi:predicted lipid-binding transport protein (Tim44 family)
MTPNIEQTKSIVRWLGGTFGGALIGWGTAKGWDISGLMSMFNTEALVGGVATGIMIIWSMVSKTKVGLIAAATTVPEVKKIEIAPVSSGMVAMQTASEIVKGTSDIVVAAPR